MKIQTQDKIYTSKQGMTQKHVFMLALVHLWSINIQAEPGQCLVINSHICIFIPTSDVAHHGW